jgi:hypothetical protein
MYICIIQFVYFGERAFISPISHKILQKIVSIQMLRTLNQQAIQK